MSKIVKYCNSCEEGFAEKFGFCPNCGSQLEAFAMNPVEDLKTELPKAAGKIKKEVIVPAETAAENFPAAISTAAPLIEQPIAAPPIPMIEEKTPVVVAAVPAEPIVPAVPTVNTADEIFEAPKTKAAAAGASNTFHFAPDEKFADTPTVTKINREYYVTVMEEKNVKQRNMLLLGSLLTMVVLILAGTVYSLFAKDLLVGSIDQGDLIASVPEITPAPVDELPPPKKDKKDGGGGGGGGKEEDNDVAKGRLPPQVKDPITPPDVNIPRLTNPELKLLQQTKGNNPRPITDENTGLPNGLATGGNGRGSGGGIGNGTGTGVGNGRGTGEGNGIGSGSGNGIGPGSGDGTGPGGQREPPPPPPQSAPKPVGPTKGLNITSKPRPGYTDSARTAQIQGTVTLKVTFLANGQIGGISTVSGLPNGLTEQAIAAARAIKFEPAMKNGQPQIVSKTISYSFSIY